MLSPPPEPVLVPGPDRPALSPGSSGAPGGGRIGWLAAHRSQLLMVGALGAIVAGAVLHLGGLGPAGQRVWQVAVAVLAIDLAYEVGRSLVVDRNVGVDTIALVALVGALALGEELAGAVIGLMFTGGATLESVAARRARRELTGLIERVPKVAQLRVGDGLREVPVASVVIGDVLLVRSGEVVPVDGTVAVGEAVIDASTLTGEPLPVAVRAGGEVLSGTANAGPPFELRATQPASRSAYTALVRVVEQAQTQRAPMMRVADRYAGVFLPVTLVVAGLAWILSGDPVRALAVVVVATPCPLILAAPIALVAGLSRAARIGVILKATGAVETLGRARTVLFDKTGTVTVGTPRVREVIACEGYERDEVLRLAASVDRLSAHVLGRSLAGAAEAEGLVLALPSGVSEDPGQGIAGTLGERRVLVGSQAFLTASGVAGAEIDQRSATAGHGSGEARVLVGVDGHLAGIVVMGDELRPDARTVVARLRGEGITYVAMVTGDRRSVAERVGRELGVDRVYAELSPADKLAIVRTIQGDAARSPVIMVGDGINDAPALALADLGIAMGAAGATVSSETADAVITVDRIDRVADAVRIGRRSLRIARQSVLVGMGLSFAAMTVAAFGYLPPVSGALFQEVVDVAVILNALRALRGDRRPASTPVEVLAVDVAPADTARP